MQIDIQKVGLRTEKGGPWKEDSVSYRVINTTQNPYEILGLFPSFKEAKNFALETLHNEKSTLEEKLASVERQIFIWNSNLPKPSSW